MSNVEEIERAVESLTPGEKAAFAAWFEEHQAEAWDRQIETDANAGRLDWLVGEVIA